MGGSSEVPAERGRGDVTGGSPRHRRVWMAIAALLVAVGVGSTIFAFSGVRVAAARSHKDFMSSSVGIAATLRLAIQHEQDLTVSTESFVIGDPDPTQAEFTQWARDVGALQRYPELLGLVVMRYVPAEQLGAYAKAESTEQSTPFTVIPAGARPYYCFAAIGVERKGQTVPSNYNLCGGALGPKVLAARASGESAVLPLTRERCEIARPRCADLQHRLGSLDRCRSGGRIRRVDRHGRPPGCPPRRRRSTDGRTWRPSCGSALVPRRWCSAVVRFLRARGA